MFGSMIETGAIEMTWSFEAKGARDGRLATFWCLTVLAALLSFPLAMESARAQTVPTDLIEVSMEDLFAANVLSDGDTAIREKRWHLSYRYATSFFNEYFDGTQSRTYEEVLWRPGEERTDKNYPVVPTEIQQEVHGILVGYDVGADLTVRASMPFITQSTDHISIVPGYDAFNITSSGIGDIVVMADYVLHRTVNSVFRVAGGVSIPTGSIDEQGDTPRSAGDQQLPYSMQLGSGTWDTPMALIYEKYGQSINWGADVRGTFRLDENDRDYRLGNKFGAGVWLSFQSLGWIDPGIRLDYKWQDMISGEDGELSVPNPQFPYPAPVVNPKAYGGAQVDLALFAQVELGTEGWFTRLEYSEPLYLDLNGPQSGEDYHLSITLGTSL